MLNRGDYLRGREWKKSFNWPVQDLTLTWHRI